MGACSPKPATFSCGMVAGINGVHTGPGATALTRIPRSFLRRFHRGLHGDVVHEDVQRAELRDRAFHDLVAPRGVAEIAGQGE